MTDWRKHLLLLGLIALFSRGKGVYLTLYAFAAVTLGWTWASRYAARRLVLRRRIGASALFPGERTQISLTLSNQSGVPLTWLTLSDAPPPALAVESHCRFAASIGGREEKTLSYTVTAKRRGVARYGAPTIVTGDPFGIGAVSVTPAVPGDQPQEIVIYPNVYPLKRLGVSDRLLWGGSGVSRRAQPDPFHVIGTRDYTPRESTRHVHWKASAQKGSLLVKRFAPSPPVDLRLVVDLVADRFSSWEAEPLSEFLIDVAASIVVHVTSRRHTCSLMVIGRTAAPAGGELETKRHDRQGTSGIAERAGLHVTQGVIVRSGLQGTLGMIEALNLLARVELSSEPIPLSEALERSPFPGRDGALWIITPDGKHAAAAAVASPVGGKGRGIHIVEVGDGGEPFALPRGMTRTLVPYRAAVAAIGGDARGR